MTGALPERAAPFVTTLRARADVIRLGAPDAAVRWTVRVQMAEAWDLIRVVAPPTQAVVEIKVAVLAALEPDAEHHAEYVLKLHGFEVLDETASLADVGATDGSIFLLAYRRRRPVR